MRRGFVFAALSVLTSTIGIVLRPIPVLPQTAPPVDTVGLAGGPRSILATRLERTLFKIDVLSLELRFGQETTRRLAQFGPRISPEEADRVVRVLLDTRDAFAHIRFERNLSLGQFLDGLQETARHARDAGIIQPATYVDIVARSPRWYGFLAKRRIHDGDEMFYRIRGDTLRTVYRGTDGVVLLDQLDVGRENCLAVLGGYLAPHSDFRKGLLRSLNQ